MFLDDSDHDGSDKVAAFLDGVLRRFDLGDRWAFQALHADGRSYGLSEGQLAAPLRLDADGSSTSTAGPCRCPSIARPNRLIFLETDPVAGPDRAVGGRNPQTIEFLDPHCAFFTFGENYGRPDCLLPVSDRYDFRPTRQPVVLDLLARTARRRPARCSRPSATGVSDARAGLRGRALHLEQAPRVPQVPRPPLPRGAGRSSWR